MKGQVSLSVPYLVVLVAVFLLSGTVALANELPPRVIIPQNATYSNRAWGYAGGGKDSIAGMHIVLVDLETSAETIAQYKSQGLIVQCYFSVGTAEKFRPDFSRAEWDSLALGNLPQFQDEYWLDLSQLEKIKDLMLPRFQRAQQRGCDAIEPDNTDCYGNAECKKPLLKRSPGLNIREKQIEYCKWQVEVAHQLGMAISLKNSLAIIPDVVDIYDFAVNEQCHQYAECHVYAPFISAGKAVFNHEYRMGAANTCTKSRNLKIQTKRCVGTPAQGICKKGKPWQNCFAALPSIPETQYTNGTGTVPPSSSRPSSSPTPKPSKSPTKYPTRFPTRRRRRRRSG